MASLYKRARSPFWWIKWSDDSGNLRQESTGKRWNSVQQTREARVIRAEKEMQERSCDPGERSHRELKKWVPKWIAETYREQETTLEVYLGSFDRLLIYFEQQGVRTAGDITREMCFDYLAWRRMEENGGVKGGVGRNTAIRDLRVLRLILNEAMHRHHLKINPASRMKLKAAATQQKPEISEEQRSIVEAAELPEWMKISWAIAMAQGCRLAETAVALSDVDFSNNTITFTLKGKRRHTTLLMPDIKPLLMRLKDEGCTHAWAFHRNASRDWSRQLATLGMPFSFHSTRVTVITRLARSGVNEQSACRFIGHCSREVHAIYTRLKVDDLDPCVRALSSLPKAELQKTLSPKASALKKRARGRDKPARAETPRREAKIGRPAKTRRG